jgi:hypothetical protein
VAEGERIFFLGLTVVRLQQRINQKSFYHYGQILFEGLCTDGVLVCTVIAREHKKSILGCTFFFLDGCMRDGVKKKSYLKRRRWRAGLAWNGWEERSF